MDDHSSNGSPLGSLACYGIGCRSQTCKLGRVKIPMHASKARQVEPSGPTDVRLMEELMNTGTDRPGRRVGSDPRRSTPARKIFKAIWAVAGTVGVAISAVVGYMTETQRGVIFQQIA